MHRFKVIFVVGEDNQYFIYVPKLVCAQTLLVIISPKLLPDVKQLILVSSVYIISFVTLA